MPAPPSRLQLHEIGDITVVRFADAQLLIDEQIQAAGKELFVLVEERGRSRLLLDLGNIEYLASAVLGKFITLNKKTQNAGGRLVLCNVGEGVGEAIRLSKLDRLFTIREWDQAADPGAELGGVWPPISGQSAAPPPPASA
jgi:anti-sigma B factor antagonist